MQVPSYTTGIQEYPVCQPESRIPPSRIQEYPSTLVDLKSGTLTRSCGQSLGNLTRAMPLRIRNATCGGSPWPGLV